MNQNHSALPNRKESTPNIATAQLLQAIEEAQEKHALFPMAQGVPQIPQPVLVGVSGGADSVCLLHALSLLTATWPITLHIAHIDHNLRPESSQDAAFVKRLAAKLSAPFYLHHIPANALMAEGGGVENAARNARYAFFHRCVVNIASDMPPHQRENVHLIPVPVVVAHHADDQIETMLMRLVRGSGLRGLSGMRWSQEIAPKKRSIDGHPIPKMRVVRPLLRITQQQIRDYLAENELDWVEDASNHNIDIVRNRIRHQIVPELKEINPNLAETIAQTAEVVAGEAGRAEEQDSVLLRQIMLEQNKQRFVLDLDAFLAFDDKAIQRGILRLALERLTESIGKSHEQISYVHVHNLLDILLQKQHASGPHTIVENLKWSVAGAWANLPRRLSLHVSGPLPFAAEHPFLNRMWRQTTGQILLPEQGTIMINEGWMLQVQRMDVNDVDVDAMKRSLAGNSGWHLQERWCAYLDAKQLTASSVRTPTDGDRIAPLGQNGQSKKVGDLFTDQKVPKALRIGWPLLVDGEVDGESGRVLWVSGIQISHEARITAETTEVIHLRWQRIKDINDIPRNR